MPLKIYLPNGDESTWENEMLKCGDPRTMTSAQDGPHTEDFHECPLHGCKPVYPVKADHQRERMSIQDKMENKVERMSIEQKMEQIFPRAPWEPFVPVDLDSPGSPVQQVTTIFNTPVAPHYYPEHEVKAEVPKHYAKGGIETIDHIRAKLSPEEFCGYCRGNVMKYIDRYSEKGGIEDLKKLTVYAKWLVAAYEKRLIFPHKIVE